MDKMLTYHLGFNNETMQVKLVKKLYPNGRLAIAALTPMKFSEELLPDEILWEPAFVATVNLVDETCPEGEVWIKDYSENEGMVEWLVEQGIIEEKPTAYSCSGYVGITRHKLKAGWEEKFSDE